MDRDELHDLVMLLKSSLASGQISAAKSSPVHASMNAVRFAEDGRVIPESVDGIVRAAALAAAGEQQRREMREISLREVQTQYFEILDQFFGEPFSEMNKHSVSPADIAQHLSSQESIVRAFQTDLPKFLSVINEFWDHFGPVVDLHLSEMNSLKSVFGGDVFPSYTANIACSVGLYMDTVVLPDPLLRVLRLARTSSSKESLYLLSKHALSAMRYRSLALAEVDPPIVVIAGDPMFRESSYLAGLQIASDGDVLEHASAMFGRRFSDGAALHTFLSGFSDADHLVTELADTSRFLFDLEWSEPAAEQFAKYVADMTSKVPGAVGKSIAETTYMAFSGRMMQANDLLFRSARYNGTPLIDAPTSWQYLLWKYEYDAERSGTPPDRLTDAVISRAIATEGSSEIGMLSGIPPEALIQLRLNGAMADLRETIRNGLNAIDSASPGTFAAVTDGVISNIDRAFEQHDKQVRELNSSRKKFFGLDISRWFITGGISLAAALKQNVELGVLAAVLPAVLGAPSLADLQNRFQELRGKGRDLQRLPTAILFRHIGKKFGFSN